MQLLCELFNTYNFCSRSKLQLDCRSYLVMVKRPVERWHHATTLQFVHWNPKRQGSRAADRWEQYSKAKTSIGCILDVYIFAFHF